MIPHKIHYCWFGRNPLPVSTQNFILAWKKKLPDYEIVEWNEDNFDVNGILFTKEAYALKKYAFVSDYVRAYVLFHEGGIYLDTDVEVLRSFSPFLEDRAFLGFEMQGKQVATAVIGCHKGEKWLLNILKYYESIPFIRFWGKLNSTPNPILFNETLIAYGLENSDVEQYLNNGIHILPSEIFSAKDYLSKEYYICSKTICVHHFSESWVSHSNSFFSKAFRMIKNIIVKLYIKFN